jgi:hypothetical protein
LKKTFRIVCFMVGFVSSTASVVAVLSLTIIVVVTVNTQLHPTVGSIHPLHDIRIGNIVPLPNLSPFVRSGR